MARTTTSPSDRALAAILEKAWDADLFNSQRGLATRLGWTSFHVLRSRGSKAGFPDRTLWRERVLFAELKRERTAATDEQVRVLTGLAKAGAETYLWRPSDLSEIGDILGRRWRWLFDRDGHGPGELGKPAGSGLDSWTPGSLWTPDGGRADEKLTA